MFSVAISRDFIRQEKREKGKEKVQKEKDRVAQKKRF